MSFEFFLKNTRTPSEIPSLAQIGLNELFVNTSDGLLYMAKQGPSDTTPQIICINPPSTAVSLSNYLTLQGGTLSGGLSLSGGGATGGLTVVNNMAANLPQLQGGLYAGWNFTNGAGEVAFFNTFTTAQTSFTFAQMLSSNVSRPIMTMLASGNIGIGVTNPTARLHVTGGAVIDNLTVSGTFTAAQYSVSVVDAGYF